MIRVFTRQLILYLRYPECLRCLCPNPWHWRMCCSERSETILWVLLFSSMVCMYCCMDSVKRKPTRQRLPRLETRSKDASQFAPSQPSSYAFEFMCNCWDRTNFIEKNTVEGDQKVIVSEHFSCSFPWSRYGVLASRLICETSEVVGVNFCEISSQQKVRLHVSMPADTSFVRCVRYAKNFPSDQDDKSSSSFVESILVTER